MTKNLEQDYHHPFLQQACETHIEQPIQKLLRYIDNMFVKWSNTAITPNLFDNCIISHLINFDTISKVPNPRKEDVGEQHFHFFEQDHNFEWQVRKSEKANDVVFCFLQISFDNDSFLERQSGISYSILKRNCVFGEIQCCFFTLTIFFFFADVFLERWLNPKNRN